VSDGSCASRFAIVVVVSISVCAAQATAATLDVQLSTGTVIGVIADDTGAPLASATVTLTTGGGSRIEATMDSNGSFSVANIPSGPFTLEVAAHGFAGQTLPGTVAAGEVANLGEIRLRLAVNAMSVEVTPSVTEIAEQQIKEQEQQRVFGIVPNFYISFTPDAAPLNPRQKFQLSWKTRTDPMQFAFVAVVGGCAASARRLQRIRRRRVGLCEAVRGGVRRRMDEQHDDARRDAVGVPAGSALLLQRHGQYTVAARVRAVAERHP